MCVCVCVCVYVPVHGVMVSILGNRPDNPSLNLDEAIHISHSANTFEKGMNQNIFPSVMGK